MVPGQSIIESLTQDCACNDCFCDFLAAKIEPLWILDSKPQLFDFHNEIIKFLTLVLASIINPNSRKLRISVDLKIRIPSMSVKKSFERT